MDSKTVSRRSLFAVLLSLLLALMLFAASAAQAEDVFIVDNISVDKQTVYPGQTVKITVKWTNETGMNINATARAISDNGATSYVRDNIILGASGSTTIEFPIDTSATWSNYGFTLVSGQVVLWDPSYAFTVAPITASVAIVSPTQVAPVEVFAGEAVTVEYKYTVEEVATSLNIVVGNNVAGKTVNLSETTSLTSKTTTVDIPASTPEGTYTLALSVNGSAASNQEAGAIKVKKKPSTTAEITAPTKSNPVTVAPGGSVTVKYDYSVPANTAVFVRLVQSNGTVLVSKEETLAAGTASKSTVLTVPAGAALGKYNVVVVTKSGNTVLHTQQEAVIVETKATIDITAPTKSKPVSLFPGDKLSLTVDYKADNQVTLDMVLQVRNSDTRLRAPLTFEKATSTKSKTFSITIPTTAAAGQYDLMIEVPGGTVYDTEREAVIIDTKATADITGPTKSNPVTVKAGNTVTVKFDYTATADADIEVKILKTDGSVLASAGSSLAKTTTKKTKTTTVSIPGSAAPGKYNLSITSKYSGKVLDTETQAVIVEDPITVKVQSPTAAQPVRVNTGDKVDVKFTYTSEASGNVEARLLKPDGQLLVSKSLSLVRSTTSRAETVTLNLPIGTPGGSYDLELISKITDSRLALESKAVSVVSFPVNIQARFVIGQSGRWMNGVYQPTDMDVRIIQGRTMLPIRHVGEPLGWGLGWDGSKQMATVTKGDRMVRVWVNSNNAQISTNNGGTWRTVRIDPDNASVQPVLISGRVLLPLRFVSENLDTRVDWDASTKSVTVTQR